jgi:hypothetical protein
MANLKLRSIVRTTKRHFLVVLVAAVILVLAGCSGSDPLSGDTITGVVSEVNGDLTTVTGFVVLAPDGSSHRFTPADGLLFEGGPLSHLREHVITGQVIVVTFEQGPDGGLIAVHVEDA